MQTSNYKTEKGNKLNQLLGAFQPADFGDEKFMKHFGNSEQLLSCQNIDYNYAPGRLFSKQWSGCALFDRKTLKPKIKIFWDGGVRKLRDGINFILFYFLSIIG